jgi:hypothetical protein
MSKMGRRGGQPPGGIAIYLLSDELPEVADHARAAARRLAGRIGDLGGVITADPGSLSTAADENEFTIPTAQTPAPSPPMRGSASTPSSPRIRISWTRLAAGMT